MAVQGCLKEGCEVQNCFLVCTMLSKMKWMVSSTSVHYMAEPSETSDPQNVDTSVCDAVKRCRRLNLEYFSSQVCTVIQELAICIKVQYF